MPIDAGVGRSRAGVPTSAAAVAGATRAIRTDSAKRIEGTLRAAFKRFGTPNRPWTNGRSPLPHNGEPDSRLRYTPHATRAHGPDRRFSGTGRARRGPRSPARESAGADVRRGHGAARPLAVHARPGGPEPDDHGRRRGRRADA